MAEHTIEPELQQTPPRKVRQRGSSGNGTRLAQLLMLPFLVLIIGGPLWAFHGIHVQLAGPLVPCEIVDRYIVQRDDGPNHYVVYRMPPPGNPGFPVEMVDEASYNKVAVGNRVPLQMSSIFPGHGSILRIPGRDMTGTLIGSLFFAALMLGMGALLVWFVYILPIRARRLTVMGLPVVGSLVDKSQISSADDEVTGYYFHYEFQPIAQNSPALTGKQKVNHKEFAEPQIGAQFTVLYDPKKPQSSMLYAFGDYEIVG